MKRSLGQRNEGMALIVSMIFLIVMGLLGTFITSRVINNIRHVDKYVDFSNTFEGVEAAFAQAEVEVQQSLEPLLPADQIDGLIGVDPAFNFANSVPAFGDALVTPLTIASRPEIQYFAYSFNWATDGVDNNGDGLVDTGPEAAGFYSIYSTARVSRFGNVSATRMAEEVVQAVNINVWQNAIFAGSGQGGNLINGNVSIHGSVHLLGTDLAAGAVAIAALDLSGTSLIHNNYDGLSAGLRARIPGLPTSWHAGELVETLNASLRVRNGLVGMSGNSEVGEVHMLGNAYKETMDGVYVNDGWTGTDLDANGDPQSVHSDNGWDNEYDLGDAVPFPTYADDGGNDHLAYYLETDANPNEGLQQVYTGDMTIQPGSGSFYWNATSGAEVIAGTPGDGSMPLQADLDPDEFYVWFDDSTDTMVINGRIPVDGNLYLTAGNGNGNKTINYEGKGSFLTHDGGSGTTGDVEISATLLTTNYPVTNLLGVQSMNDMLIGSSSQMEMMGGFYCQNEITVNKQTTILGTIVGDVFNMGTNVPDIYQVPTLPNAWNGVQRMIGANPVLFLAPQSWRELAVS